MVDQIQLKKGPLQQHAVQYNVTGSLDGVTPAPSMAAGAVDEEGVVQIDVENLGLIDPDFFGGVASRGDRFVIWMRIEMPVTWPPGSRISRVNASEYIPLLGIIELQRFSTAAMIGTRLFTTTECATIPQGQAIQILGPAAPAGTPITVKLGVRQAASADDEARLSASCCCQIEAAGGDDGGGGGPDVDVSLDFYSFSAEEFTTPGNDNGTYFHFSALRFSPTPLTSMNESESIINASEGVVRDSSIKLAIRDGEVTSIALRCTSGFTFQPFIEVSTGGGAFVRTFIGAVQVLAANTTTIIPCEDGLFSAGDRYRVGINITTEVLISTILAEVEISTSV